MFFRDLRVPRWKRKGQLGLLPGEWPNLLGPGFCSAFWAQKQGQACAAAFSWDPKKWGSDKVTLSGEGLETCQKAPLGSLLALR